MVIEERIRKDNFKKLFSFLITQEKKIKDLYIEILDKYTIEVIYHNGRHDWNIAASTKGVIWSGDNMTMTEFKRIFKSIFEGYNG